MIVHSKILAIPIFHDLPKTDAADCKENIDLWLDDDRHKNSGKVQRFLIEDPKGYRGYRFIRSSDLETIIKTKQKILGVEIELEFFRGVETKDSFCPLWFSECYGRSHVKFNIYGREFEFKSDNNLKIEIRNFKQQKRLAVEFAESLKSKDETYLGAKLWSKFSAVLNSTQCQRIANEVANQQNSLPCP